MKACSESDGVYVARMQLPAGSRYRLVAVTWFLSANERHSSVAVIYQSGLASAFALVIASHKVRFGRQEQQVDAIAVSES